MNFLRKIGNSFARFMYGRNGMDHLNLALIWLCLICSLLSSLLRERKYKKEETPCE